MAGKIIPPRELDTYGERPNAILGVTEVRTFAVAYSDKMGRRRTCMLYQFGTDKTDNRTSVWLIADHDELQAKLARPKGAIMEAVRKVVEAEEKGTDQKVPEDEVEDIIGDDLEALADDIVSNSTTAPVTVAEDLI